MDAERGEASERWMASGGADRGVTSSVPAMDPVRGMAASSAAVISEGAAHAPGTSRPSPGALI